MNLRLSVAKYKQAEKVFHEFVWLLVCGVLGVFVLVLPMLVILVAAYGERHGW